MLRFAPDATKELSIDNLRVALFNFIIAKQQNEDLLIRIDDAPIKNDEKKDKEILELLSLFSIDYKGAVYQSDNLKYHQKMAMQLMSQKKAFACFCSDEKLKELKQTAKKEKKPYEYDGFCSTLSDETVLNCNAPFTVRIQKPLENIIFEDEVQGKKEYSASQVDAFFILNHDKSPTYNFACAVDDMLYNISTVIRSNQHLLNTAKQIHIRSSLGYEKDLNYIHVPAVSSSKKNENSVKWLIDEGFLPSAIANYLVLLGYDTPKEIFTLEEALEWFDIKKISKNEIDFDIKKLRSINQKHLETMDNMRLSKILGFADTDIGQLAKLFLKKSSTIKEIKKQLDLIFTEKKEFKGSQEIFSKVQTCLKSAPYFDKLDDLKAYIIQETSLDNQSLKEPLNYILTGQNKSLDISKIYPLIKNYLGEIIQ